MIDVKKKELYRFKLRIYPNKSQFEDILKLFKLYTNWYNSQLIQYHDEHRNFCKFIGSMTKNHCKDDIKLKNDKVASFKLPKHFNPEKSSYMTDYKMYRTMTLSTKKVDVRYTENKKIVILFNNNSACQLRLNVKDRRADYINYNKLQEIRLVVYDSHEGPKSRSNRYKFYLILVTKMRVDPIDIDYEVDCNNFDIDKKESVGIDLGVSTLLTLSKPMLWNGVMTKFINFPDKTQKLISKYHAMKSKYKKALDKAKPRNFIKGKTKKDKSKLPDINFRYPKAWHRRRSRSQSPYFIASDRLLDKMHFKLRRMEEKIMRQSIDFVHKVINSLFKQFEIVYMEADLEIRKSYQDKKRTPIKGIFSCIDEFQHIIKYKARRFHKVLVQVPKEFASSKLCNCCHSYGYIWRTTNKFNSTSIRSWDCDCGAHHNRDVNAAINIEKVGKLCLEYRCKNYVYPNRIFSGIKYPESYNELYNSLYCCNIE